ncbi:MAG: ABC transporter ATP-binding protein [Brevinematales bacterium]|nr:ABC transporter ATP-binding protein [Brevinematales bacterium]
MAEIIRVENLYKEFGNEVKTVVLKGINLTFEKNVFTALIGPSGSGKTTFLNVISLLEPPTSGKLIIDGIDFSHKNVNDSSDYRNENFGFVFQFHYLLPEFTVYENILMPFWIENLKITDKIERKARNLMEEIDIWKIKDKYPSQISGGQQQRTSIARALVKNPKIIFADEPTGNLDKETGNTVLKIMLDMIKEYGTTLIMVTHDREIALNAERVIELVDGKICKSFLVKEEGLEKAKKILEDRSCIM